MADTKISALTGATTPLAGTEVLPVVQSGVTKKVSVANLTAGLTVDGANFQTPGTGQFRGSDDASYVIYQASTTAGAASIYLSGSTRGGFPSDMSLGCTEFSIYNSIFSSRKFNINGVTGNVSIDRGNAVFGTAAKGINFTANTPAAGMTSQLLNWYEEGTWTPGQGSGLAVSGAFTSTGTYTRVGRQVTVCGRVRGATSVTMSAGELCTNMPFSADVTTNICTGAVLNNTLTASGSCLAVGTTLYSPSFSAVTELTFSCTYFI